jgi:uncharacterized iron-regulated membrane protein
MNAAKVSRLGHRWIALVVGLQLLIWALSGLYMVTLDLDFIHGDPLVRNVTPAFELDTPRVPLARLAQATPGAAESLRLRALPDGQQVYEIGQGGHVTLFDAKTGARLSPLPKNRVADLARRYYAGTGRVASVTLLKREADRPSEIQTRKLPLWRVDFDDRLETSLYIHPDSGALIVRRHRFWRWFDFLWSLHIMDYQERTDVNNWLLRGATLLGLTLAASGLWLAFFSFPFLQRRRARRTAP